jgi:hypothetical protein
MEKKIIRDIINICIFIALINLPFITMAQIIGIDTFTDSFEKPEFYQYFKSSKIDLGTITQGYLVIKKPSHPDFSIFTGDKIFYYNDEGRLLCRSIHNIKTSSSIKKYYIVNLDGDIDDEPIYNHQIIGKVVGFVDNNAWNKISLKLWDASINNLNAVALLVSV